ncbi:hypothetical protein LSH36_9g02020 [Paralvinella palmiformis]|uniref:Uncharacterized protein n=1 Tax=Paralvinella palmiformis TaxID=53620 RepID=A0AAD9KD59_9ANNE|nr:hypothetical protein LSH36_9g02020 [Paralvinella palmiformis]
MYVLNLVTLGIISIIIINTAPEYINGSYQYHHCYQEGGRCDKKYISCQEGYVLNIESARIGYSDYWYLDPTRTNCSVTNETCYEEIEEPANNCTELRVCGLDTCSESTHQRIECSEPGATNYMQINYTCIMGTNMGHNSRSQTSKLLVGSIYLLVKILITSKHLQVEILVMSWILNVFERRLKDQCSRSCLPTRPNISYIHFVICM